MRRIGSSFTVIILLTLSLLFSVPNPDECRTRQSDRPPLGSGLPPRVVNRNRSYLQARLRESACALMTTNTAGTRSAGNTHATLGAGAPARSDQQGGLALNADEKWMGTGAGLLYQQLTGELSRPAGQVILLRLPEAFRLNFSPTHTAIPCLLGQVLTKTTGAPLFLATG